MVEILVEIESTRLKIESESMVEILVEILVIPQ